MPISLSIKDRYELIKYAHKLQSTIPLRMAIDAFFAQIELTDEERKEHGVTINKGTFELTCTNDSYVVAYESFHPDVVKAISDFVKSYDTDEAKKNQVIQSALAIFKKIV